MPSHPKHPKESFNYVPPSPIGTPLRVIRHRIGSTGHREYGRRGHQHASPSHPLPQSPALLQRLKRPATVHSSAWTWSQVADEIAYGVRQNSSLNVRSFHRTPDGIPVSTRRNTVSTKDGNYFRYSLGVWLSHLVRNSLPVSLLVVS
jgi:hypothetical protein